MMKKPVMKKLHACYIQPFVWIMLQVFREMLSRNLVMKFIIFNKFAEYKLIWVRLCSYNKKKKMQQNNPTITKK